MTLWTNYTDVISSRGTAVEESLESMKAPDEGARYPPSPGDVMEAQDNDPAMVAEIDRLNEAMRSAAAGDTAPEIALWQQVARLPAWFFIQRGEGDQSRPYALAADDGTMICIYSSALRAKECAVGLALIEDESATVPLMAVPTRAAIDWLASLSASGVFGITLDYPLVRAATPLANLSQFGQWLEASG